MSKIRSLGHSPNARAMLEGIHSGIEVSLLFRPGIRRMPLVPYGYGIVTLGHSANALGTLLEGYFFERAEGCPGE